MLDIKFVRNNPEVVKQNIKNKFQDDKLPLVDEVIELDQRNREIKQEVEALAFVVYEIAEDVLLWDRHSVFFVRADALEEFIKSFIVQWMIDEAQNAVFGQFDAYT